MATNPVLEALLAPHPLHGGERLTRLRALYEGGDLWHSLVRTWLPKNPAEEEVVYNGRIEQAVYVNHASAIVDLLAAWLLDQPVEVQNAPSFYERLKTDANGHGTPLSTVLRDAFTAALVEKCVYVWVDRPSDGGAAPSDRLDQEKRGLDQPIYSTLSASSVTNWGNDERGKLAWILYYSQSSRQDGPTAPRKYIHTWKMIDAQRVTTWTVVKDKPDPPDPKEDTISSKVSVDHNYGVLPVVRFDLSPGLRAMEKIHDPALRYVRAHNDRHWALYRGAHAVLTLTEGSGTPKAKAPSRHVPGPDGLMVEVDRTINIGPSAVIEIDNGGEAAYLEPSGTTFDALRQAEQDARDDIYRVVHQMALSVGSGDSARSQSGSSKQADWEPIQVVMSAYSQVFKDFVADLFHLTGKVAGEDWEPVIQGLNGWKHQTVEQFLDAAVLTVGAQTMSETFQREVSKVTSRLVLGNFVTADVLDKIADEIDESETFGANLALPGKTLGDDRARLMGIPSTNDILPQKDPQPDAPPADPPAK